MRCSQPKVTPELGPSAPFRDRQHLAQPQFPPTPVRLSPQLQIHMEGGCGGLIRVALRSRRSLGSLYAWLSSTGLRFRPPWSPGFSDLSSWESASFPLSAPRSHPWRASQGDYPNLLVSCLSVTLSCAACCPVSEHHSSVGFVSLFTCCRQMGKSNRCLLYLGLT